MRKQFLFALLVGTAVLGGSLSSRAVDATPTPSNPGAGRQGGIGEKLGLTAAQKAQIKQILTAAHQQAESATDKNAKLAIYKGAFQKIKTEILTDAQRKKFEELKPELEARLKALAKERQTKPATGA